MKKLSLPITIAVILVVGYLVFTARPADNQNGTVIQSPPPNTSEVGCDDMFSSGEFIISKSTREGYCDVTVPLAGYKTIGYSLSYPEGWTVRLAGAEGMNLFFNEGINSGTKKGLFLQLTLTDLPLEQADKATYNFEWSGADPLVSPEESIQSKRIETIGDKQVLTLITSEGDLYLNRYFLLKKRNEYTTLYMLRSEDSKSDYEDRDYIEFLNIVREII